MSAYAKAYDSADRKAATPAAPASGSEQGAYYTDEQLAWYRAYYGVEYDPSFAAQGPPSVAAHRDGSDGPSVPPAAAEAGDAEAARPVEPVDASHLAPVAGSGSGKRGPSRSPPHKGSAVRPAPPPRKGNGGSWSRPRPSPSSPPTAAVAAVVARMRGDPALVVVWASSSNRDPLLSCSCLLPPPPPPPPLGLGAVVVGGGWQLPGSPCAP